MAFENLEPFKDEIIALRRPGPDRKTLVQVCEILLERHRLRTTPGTLSRYLKELQRTTPDIAPREADPAEEQHIEAAALLTEVLVEVRGRSEEQRLAIEHLAGQVRVATQAIEELEKAIAGQPAQSDGAIAVSPTIIRRIWGRAFLVSAVVVGIIATVAVWYLTQT